MNKCELLICMLIALDESVILYLRYQLSKLFS